jgi:hypothetical protein
MSETKVVQTRLPIEKYKEIHELARKENKTLKEVAKEAILEYLLNKSKFNEHDPLFKLKAVDYRDERASEDVDKILYGKR